MAYSERFYHQYCNSEGVTCRVSILQEDFVGSTTEVEAQQVPFRKIYESSSDFKFEPIRPSKGVVSLVFGTGNGVDFEELWTADEREFKVEHYINSVLDWVGYIVPNGFAYEFSGGVYYAQIDAADGLSLLEKIAFANTDGEPYGTQDLTYNNGFEFPFILIATEILRKLELDLDTWTCVDVYERSMTKTGDTRNADPLAVSYANVKTYINDSDRKDIPYWADAGEVFNCKEVLENLCYLFGAKVYQSEGVWRIKRINADAEYGSGATQRYWRKYNTLAVYLGQETINKEDTIPCSTITKAMIGDDHVMRMDDVYGAFRINYEFTFLRQGDTPLSLITNGDFSDFNNTSKLAAPTDWFRWRDDPGNNTWHLGMRPVDVSAESPGGFTTAVEIGRQDPSQSSDRIDSTTHPWNSLRYGEVVQVSKQDTLSLSFWMKNLPRPASTKWVGCLFRIQLVTDQGEQYFLVNSPYTEAGKQYLDWRKGADLNEDPGQNPILNSNVHVGDDVFCNFFSLLMLENPDENTFKWRYFESRIANVPDSGQVIFDIHGPIKVIGEDSGNFPKMDQMLWSTKQLGFVEVPDTDVETATVTGAYTPRDGEFTENGGNVYHPLITGLNFGRIPEPNEFATELDYIYENTADYTLEVDPITVLNGDTLDPQHVSRIIVPTNVTEQKNFWDTIDDKYGPSSLGLITCKSIMNLYFKPFRILEGTVKAPGATMDTRFEFEALPGKKFMLLRGTFNGVKNYIEDATFFEISDEEIPAGGTEGKNSLEPDYIPTGRIRCEKDGSNQNTGILQEQERDSNPNSETFGQTQWVNAGTDLTYCPLGELSKYYYGTDDVSLDVGNLSSDSYYEEGDNITCIFSNPGGEYIYFVHLASLGVVEQVSTAPQESIISDFQYLSDIIVDGSTYRVLRQDYVTTEFDNISITFTFAP